MLATAEAERRMRNAGIFIKSWIYSRNFTKSWMWNVAEICCHLHQKLNLFKKVKCYQKTETQIGSKNLQRVYIRWEMLASSLNVKFIQESEMLTKCWMWNSIYGECTQDARCWHLHEKHENVQLWVYPKQLNHKMRNKVLNMNYARCWHLLGKLRFLFKN